MRWPEDQVADRHASRRPNTSGGEPRDGQRMELQVSMKPRKLWPANTQKERRGRTSTTNTGKQRKWSTVSVTGCSQIIINELEEEEGKKKGKKKKSSGDTTQQIMLVSPCSAGPQQHN